MIDHDVVAHRGAVSRRDDLAAVGREDRCSGARRHINAVVEQLVAVDRVDTVAVFRRDVRVAGARPREHAAVIFAPLLLREPCALLLDDLLEGGDLRVALRDVRLVRRDRLLLGLDVRVHGVDLRLFLGKEGLDVRLLFLHGFLRLVQRHLLFFQRLLGQLDEPRLLHIVVQLVPVVFLDLLDIPRLVQHVAVASLHAEQEVQIERVALQVHHADPLLHRLVLRFLHSDGFLQLRLGLCDLLLLLDDLFLERLDVGLDLFEIPVELCDIRREVRLVFLQLLLDLLDVAEAALQLGPLLLRAGDLAFLLFDLVVRELVRVHFQRRRAQPRGHGHR